jgi:hypothetical protein
MTKIITPFGLPVVSTTSLQAEIQWFRRFLEKYSLTPIPGSAFAQALDSAERTAILEQSLKERRVSGTTASELRRVAGVEFLIKAVFRVAKDGPPKWLLDDLKFFRKAQVPFDEPYKMYSKSNHVWEFICACIVSSFTAQLSRSEPDITSLFRGRKIGIACKVLSTDNPQKQIRRIVKGVEQIENADIEDGFVFVNISRLLDHRKYFDVEGGDVATYRDFKLVSTPQETISRDMSEILNRLVELGLARPLVQKGYPFGRARIKLRLVNFFAQTIVCV